MLDKTHHFQALNRLWPPMGSMDIHVLQAMTAIRSSCFERLGCLGRPLELWLTPQISQCGNLWKSVEICGMLDLSGSVSPAPIRMLRLDALCMFRDIVVSPTSQGVTMGRARDHLISPKMLCRNFEHHWFMIWHVFTCFYMFLHVSSNFLSDLHPGWGPSSFWPFALWSCSLAFLSLFVGSLWKSVPIDQCGILTESDWSILIPPNQMLHERLNWIMQMDSEWCNIATFMLRPGHRPYI